MSEYSANRHISVLYRYGQRFFAQRLENAGIEVGQFPFLLQSCAFPGITQEQISFNTGMDKGTVARMIGALEESGLVRREADASDRRINHIYPAGNAYEIREKVLAVIGEYHAIVFRGLSPGETAAAGELLSKMRGNVQAYFAGQP